jgi:hypothetical protein
MRRLLLILILSSGALPASAAGPITAEQLESLVAAAHGESDAKVAREIAGLELTERLSSARLTRCLADLPGSRSREALLVLADMSAFLDPPPSEMPAMEKPDLGAQTKMIGLTVNYINNAFHDLPNFFATRATTTFRRDLRSDKRLHRVGKYRDMELYRKGQPRLRSSRPQSRAAGLTTSGEFGPILGTAILDASKGNLTWSHWEQGEAGPEAVFRYAVTAKESHYVVQDQQSAYDGEIAVDPSSGAVLRIVLTTDLDLRNLLDIADIVVEYGPVELGGKNYLCPLKGIALSEQSQQLWLNNVVFENYHLFRPNMRILPGFNEVH